jgi:D-tyrosyl-tRNA(Tyr) deacylase
VRVLLQRVSRAAVRVAGDEIARIDRGFLALVGIGREDTPDVAAYLADRVAGLRVFDDAAGKLNLALRDIGGQVLAVSQFTLYADTSRGRRPGFEPAARPDQAAPLFGHFVDQLRALGIPVQTGRFGATMEVELVNDGPVTLLLER